MARYSEHDTEGIYRLADVWRQRCLLGNGSLLWEGEQVWTIEALEAFKKCFTDNPDELGDGFEVKYRRQLSDQEATVVKLAAELVLVYFLFPSTVSGATKRDLIQKVVSWKQIEIPPAGVAAWRFSTTELAGRDWPTTRAGRPKSPSLPKAREN